MKRFLSILLSSAMLCTILSGCSDKDASSTPPGSSGATATSSVTDELDWPKSTIKIVCPYTAGGGTDLMSRIIADKLTEMLGVSVVVEDLPGGSGAVGMSACATAKPDGYTIVMGALGAATITPNMSETGYDNTSFAPISQVTMVPNCFVVRADTGITTWEELLDYAAENGAIKYGCSGSAAPQYLNMVNLTRSIDKEELFTLVPFEGGSASVTALLGSQIDASVNIISEPHQYVKDGTFNCLWVTEESEFYPDVPTAEDLGMAGGFGLWYGFAAPAGTDERILDKLDAAIGEIMAMPEVQEQFANIGQPAVYSDRATFTDLWMATWDKNLATLQDMGISVR